MNALISASMEVHHFVSLRASVWHVGSIRWLIWSGCFIAAKHSMLTGLIIPFLARVTIGCVWTRELSSVELDSIILLILWCYEASSELAGETWSSILLVGVVIAARSMAVVNGLGITHVDYLLVELAVVGSNSGITIVVSRLVKIGVASTLVDVWTFLTSFKRLILCSAEKVMSVLQTWSA